MKEEHIFINCYNSKLNLCFSLKKLVSNYSLDILCVLEFATNRNAPKPSAGVPLTYYHGGDSALSIENLTTNFLETPFTVNIVRTYRKNGFLQNMSLVETFKNKYTNISGEKLQVRAMKAEDIYTVTGMTKIVQGNIMSLNNAKYNKLLTNGASYFIAFASNSSILWRIGDRGGVSNGYDGGMFRNSPSSIFTSYC